jgi:hypothetical protein
LHHAARRAFVMSGTGPPPELPPGVDLARDDVRGDPEAAVARGLEMMTASGEAILAGVEARGAPYVVARAIEVLDAWGKVPANERDSAVEALARAATNASRRVVNELRALLASDPAQQRRTPLEIVRTLRREPSETLAALGVPAIVRDVFEERALPDDPYGLAPRTLVDLGDADLGPMLLAWGVGKATVLRARAAGERATPSAQIGVENLSIPGAGGETRRSGLGTITGAVRGVADAVRAGLRRVRGDRS